MQVWPTLVDDRGVAHRTRVPSGTGDGVAGVLPFMRPGGTPRPWLVWAMYLAGTVMLVQLPFALSAFGGHRSMMPSGTSVVVFALGWPTICVPWMLFGAKVQQARTIRRFLAGGLCPLCAYELDGSREEEDGCVVCAECGAAWRVSSG